MKYYVLAMLVLFLAGCASPGKKSVSRPPEPDEKVIWSSHDKRPGWTVSEPEMEGDKLIFIGISGKYATEREARDDAQSHSISNVVKYLGTLAQSKFQKMQTTHGLASDITDPTNITRKLEDQLSKAFATRVKPQEWYIEKWQNKLKETYYLVYVKAGVPKAVIDDEYKSILENSIDELKKKRDAASTAKAKAQFENAMKAFEEAKKQGFTLE